MCSNLRISVLYVENHLPSASFMQIIVISFPNFGLSITIFRWGFCKIRTKTEGNPAVVYHTSCRCFSLITPAEKSALAGWCNRFMPYIWPSSNPACWRRLTRSETRSRAERDGAKEEVEAVGCKSIEVERRRRRKKKQPRVCVRVWEKWYKEWWV